MDWSRRHTDDHRVRLDIVQHDRTGTHRAPLSDMDSLHDSAPGSEQGSGPYGDAACHVCSGRDVDEVADDAVMVDRRGGVDHDVTADVRFGLDDRPGEGDGTRPEAGGGIDRGSRVDGRRPVQHDLVRHTPADVIRPDPDHSRTAGARRIPKEAAYDDIEDPLPVERLAVIEQGHDRPTFSPKGAQHDLGVPTRSENDNISR